MNRLLTSKRSNVLKSALGQASRRKDNVLRSRMHPMLSSARPNAYEFVPQQRQSEVTSWQPRENIDIQRVTQQAMVSYYYCYSFALNSIVFIEVLIYIKTSLLP